MGCSFFFFVVNFVIHWNETAMDLHLFPIPIPPPTSLSTPSLWVFPVHQVRALVSCLQPGLVICFTLDNIHVSMLFSWNIPPCLSSKDIPGLPWGLRWWRICLQCRRLRFYSWVGKIPWRRAWLPAPVFWLGESQGLYSPWGCKESDMTERLSLRISLGLQHFVHMNLMWSDSKLNHTW